MTDQIRVELLNLVIEIYDAVSNVLLKEEDLCTVKRSEIPSFQFILDAEDKLKEFEKFCDMMYDKWQEKDFGFLCSTWKRKFYSAKQFLEMWERLISLGEVKVVWKVKEDHRYDQAPMRRIPLNYSQSDPIITFEKRKN
jgi:hypothetical protein